MAVKITLMYPQPTDLEAFEHAYSTEHVPTAAPVFQAAGATKAVMSKAVGAPAGTPAFHRVAEIYFPDMATLQACAASKAGQDVLAHAAKISSGGPPVVFIAEEETITF